MTTVGWLPRKPAVNANVSVKCLREENYTLVRKKKKELKPFCRLQGDRCPDELLRTGLVWVGSSHKIKLVYLKEYEAINWSARNIGLELREC